MMDQMQIMKLLKATGALLKGHFELSSGLHSDQYLQCALVLQHPEYASLLCEELASRFKDDLVDVVCGPALGGIIVSYEVARALKARSIFCERQGDLMSLRRGFSVGRNDRVLVVEDVVTTGGSVKEIIKTVRENEGKVVGVGAIADRSNGAVDFDVRFERLLSLDIQNFPPKDCPLCKEGLPIHKPGSRTIRLKRS